MSGNTFPPLVWQLGLKMAYFCCLVVQQTIVGTTYCYLWWNIALYTIIFRRRNNFHEVSETLNLLPIQCIHCIRISSKVACSTRPIFDLLLHRNVWKRGLAGIKMYPSSNMHAFHTYFFYLHEKGYSVLYLFFLLNSCSMHKFRAKKHLISVELKIKKRTVCVQWICLIQVSERAISMFCFVNPLLCYDYNDQPRLVIQNH